MQKCRVIRINFFCNCWPSSCLPKVVGELFERIKLPSVLGEILAGAVLGPFALGWIRPSDTIYSVAEIGALFVLFSAGLETSPQDLIRVGRKALLVAVAGVVIPFVLGFVT